MSLLLTALALAASPVPQTCTFETAILTETRVIAADPEKWFGRCVRLDGYTSFYTFIEDVEGAYRRGANDEADRPNDGWLGLYFQQDTQLRRQLHRASVIGIVDSCDRIVERAEASLQPDEMIFITGYCHYTGGLILQRAEAAYKGQARFTRQVGEGKRADFGDLIPASPTNPVPVAVASMIEEWRGAFSAGDEGKLKSLVEPYDWTPEQRPKAARRLGRTLVGAEGPFQDLRETNLQPFFLLERLDDDELSEGETGDWFACFCKAGDCSRWWPIAVSDAKALTDRPYACLRVFKAMDGSDMLRLGLESRTSNLIEPALH